MRTALSIIAMVGCGRVGFAPTIDATPLPLPAVVRYAMDDDPATGVAHASDPRFDGTCTSCPVTASGHLGGAYSFAGAQQIALPAISSALATGQPYTCTAWASFDVGVGAIVAKPVSTTDITDVFSLQVDVLNRPYYETATLADAPYFVSLTPTTLTVWHHFAATWDGTTMRLYLDGVLGNAAAAQPLEASAPMWIGADQDNGAPVSFMRGLIDELVFTNRALTAAEIAALAQQ